MNPLSALRGWAMSPAPATAQVDLLSELTSPKKIQLSELEKLSPGIQPLPAATPAGFDGVLTSLVNEVNAKQAQAGELVNGLVQGKNVSLHQVMIGLEEANVSFQLMVEVRNRLLESYQELMRLQI